MSLSKRISLYFIKKCGLICRIVLIYTHTKDVKKLRIQIHKNTLDAKHKILKIFLKFGR